jgi:hypothetical protein
MSDYGDDERKRFEKGIIDSQKRSFEERVRKLTDQMVKNRNAPHMAPPGMGPRPVLTQAEYDNVRKQAELAVKENDRRYLEQELSKSDKQAKRDTRADTSQVPDVRPGTGKAVDRVGAERERPARDLGQPQEETVSHQGSSRTSPQGMKPDLWLKQSVHGTEEQKVKEQAPGRVDAKPSASVDRIESGQRRDVRSDFNKPPPSSKPPPPEQKAMLEQRIHGPVEQRVKSQEPDRVNAKVRSDFNKPPPPPKPPPPEQKIILKQRVHGPDEQEVNKGPKR